MYISSLGPQLLRESLPCVFEGRKEVWPSPARSVSQPDQPSLHLGRQKCWEVTGPALELFNELRNKIQALLDSHKDQIAQGEAKPRSVSFNMFMFGTQPENSSPVIAFISKSSRQRNYAKTLLKDSKLLKEHPSIRIKMLNKEPALPHMKVLNSEVVCEENDENGVYLIGDTDRLCGAQIAIGQARSATMGGIFLIDHKYYGVTAQHVRSKLTVEDDELDDSEPSCFDEDSDDEHLDDVEITSKGSISSHNRVDSITDLSSTSESECASDLSFPSVDALARKPQKMNDQQILIRAGDPINTPEPISRTRISSLSSQYVSSGLDYELFELDDPAFFGQNAIQVSSQGDERPARLASTHIAERPAERAIWACSSRNGPIRGTMLEASHYIKMKYSSTFQEMWVVRLEKQTVPGDCGTWVIDATNGDLYGHIVAGDSVTGLGYIVPARAIAVDIQKRFGVMPLLPSQISTFEKIHEGRLSIRTAAVAFEENQDRMEKSDLPQIKEDESLLVTGCRQELQPILHESRKGSPRNPAPHLKSIADMTNEVEHEKDIEFLRRKTYEIIDRAPFQIWVMFVASAGFLTEIYDTYAVDSVLLLWGNDPQILTNQAGASKLPPNNHALHICATLVGSVLGQLLFGVLADLVGRKKLYGLLCLTIVGSTLIFISSADRADGTMGFTGWFLFWRLMMGIGTGGDYPLSAAITSEFAPTKHRPAMLATLFFKQPLGRFITAIVPIIGTYFGTSRIGTVDGYLQTCSNYESTGHLPTTDPAWRWIAGFGIIPAMIAFILRLQIPESPRYTLDVLSDAKEAFDKAREYFEPPGKVINRHEQDKFRTDGVSKSLEDLTAVRARNLTSDNPTDLCHETGSTSKTESSKGNKDGKRDYFQYWRSGFNQYLFSEGDWIYLAGIAICWFLLDITYYSLSITSPGVIPKAWNGLNPGGQDSVWDSLLEEVLSFHTIISMVTLLSGALILYEVCRNQLPEMESHFSLVPGILLFAVGGITNAFPLSDPTGIWALVASGSCYYLLFNFLANGAMFVIPSERFPMQYRCTCIGLVAATAKLGSIIAQATLDQKLTQFTDTISQDASSDSGILLMLFGFLMVLGAIVTMIWIPDARNADGNITSLEDLANGRDQVKTLRKNCH